MAVAGTGRCASLGACVDTYEVLFRQSTQCWFLALGLVVPHCKGAEQIRADHKRLYSTLTTNQQLALHLETKGHSQTRECSTRTPIP